MFRLLILLVFLTSCQMHKPKNTRNILSKELGEYSYVINSWYFKDGNILELPENNIFLTDYLNSSSKDRPPKYLVYYFEDMKLNFAYKLKILLNGSTKPVVTFVKLISDKKSCSKQQLSNEDFRRQSCYYEKEKPIIDNKNYDINFLYNKVQRKIESSGS